MDASLRPFIPERRLSRSRLAALFAVAGLVVPGCRSSWNGGELYTPKWEPAWVKAREEAAFRVGLPGEGWKVHREQDSQVAWYHPDRKAIIQVHSQCQEHGDSDLESFTDHLRIDSTDWQVLQQRYIRVVDREALRSTVMAAFDGAPPVKLELIVVKKNGCVFDLDYLAAPANFDGGLGDYEKVVAGFDFPVRRGRGGG